MTGIILTLATAFVLAAISYSSFYYFWMKFYRKKNYRALWVSATVTLFFFWGSFRSFEQAYEALLDHRDLPVPSGSRFGGARNSFISKELERLTKERLARNASREADWRSQRNKIPELSQHFFLLCSYLGKDFHIDPITGKIVYSNSFRDLSHDFHLSDYLDSIFVRGFHGNQNKLIDFLHYMGSSSLGVKTMLLENSFRHQLTDSNYIELSRETKAIRKSIKTISLEVVYKVKGLSIDSTGKQPLVFRSIEPTEFPPLTKDAIFRYETFNDDHDQLYSRLISGSLFSRSLGDTTLLLNGVRNLMDQLKSVKKYDSVSLNKIFETQGVHFFSPELLKSTGAKFPQFLIESTEYEIKKIPGTFDFLITAGESALLAELKTTNMQVHFGDDIQIPPNCLIQSTFIKMTGGRKEVSYDCYCIVIGSAKKPK